MENSNNENVGNKKSNKLPVAIFLILIVLVLFIGVSACINPHTKLYWIVRYPSKTYNTETVSFKSPWGWDVRVWNSDNSKKIVGMSTGLFDYQDLYFDTCSPYIILYYDKDFDAERWFGEGLARVLNEVDAKEETRTINSDKYTIFRYQGNRLLCFDNNSSADPSFKYEKIDKDNSVVIAFYNERGLYGMFWGLLEQEKDFWKVLSGMEMR